MDNFTKEDAIKIQTDQTNYYSKLIKDKEKRRIFMKEIAKLRKRNISAKTPYEIPRGTEIEELYYKINLGYSDKEYGNYVSSLD